MIRQLRVQVSNIIPSLVKKLWKEERENHPPEKKEKNGKIETENKL